MSVLPDSHRQSRTGNRSGLVEMDLVYRLAINSCEPYEMQGKSNKNAHGLKYWDLVYCESSYKASEGKNIQ